VHNAGRVKTTVRLHAVRHYFPRAQKTLWRGWQGVVRKYRPDFIVKLVNDLNLVLEVKGWETEKDKTEQRFMDEWVQAVNNHGGFGEWAFVVSRDPGDLERIIRGFGG
jgi:type III restriction enzyme